MILNSNIMAERRESASERGGTKAALIALLASAGLSLAGCGKSNAQIVTPDASNTPPATEMKLASAEEAQVFASLPLDVRTEIREAYAKCMADVEEFALDASGGDDAMKIVILEDGEADCDSIRESEIGSAKAHQDMENLTKSITSDT